MSFGVTKISHRFALIELSAELRKPYSLSHTRFKTRENAGSRLTGVAAAERDIGLSYLSTFAASSRYLVHVCPFHSPRILPERQGLLPRISRGF